MLIYSPKITPRLNYIVDLIVGDLLGLSFQITTDEMIFKESTEAKICYNTRSIAENQCLIVPSGLLNERGINNHQLNIIDFAGTKALFPVYTKDSPMSFDIFSATFYMVSRYEEYLPYIRDEHGRFSAFSSLAWQKGFLQIPVVNVWAMELGKILVEKFPGLKIKGHDYQFIPTIDVDAAWAFRHKGFYRSVGGFINDFRAFDFEGMRRRFRSMLRMEADPFDSFQLMHELHQQYDLRPKFFILFSGYNDFDKSTPINNTAFQQLIKSLGDEGEVGIHPSYGSNTDETKLGSEIFGLSEVLHREVTSSRQHFLKLHLPETYRNLLAYDITDDYTMGFAAQTGFRAGICTAFKWYDLEMERITDLVIHPFALMDGTLRDYQKVEAEGAMLQILPLIEVVKSVGGTFISLFHNESLSNWRRWKGWIKVYEDMLKAATSY